MPTKSSFSTTVEFIERGTHDQLVERGGLYAELLPAATFDRGAGTNLSGRFVASRRNPRQSLRSAADQTAVEIHNAVQAPVLVGHGTVAAAASLRPGATVPDENRHRSIYCPSAIYRDCKTVALLFLGALVGETIMVFFHYYLTMAVAQRCLADLRVEHLLARAEVADELTSIATRWADWSRA